LFDFRIGRYAAGETAAKKYEDTARRKICSRTDAKENAFE